MIDRACISLNARCNLKCVYCHFASKKNNEFSKDNEFSREDAIRFSKNLEKYILGNNLPTFKLGIVGSGEPLLSFEALKTIVEFFDASSARSRIQMYTISNGTILDEATVGFFYEHKDIIELNISLDGDPEYNRPLRGSFPDFSKYEERFCRKPKINTVVTRGTIENQGRILKYFIDNGFTEVNFSKVFGIGDASLMVTDEQYESFLKEAQKIGLLSRQTNQVRKYDCAKYGRLCGVGRTNIFITKTGVYPCGRFMNNKNYLIGEWDAPISEIEQALSKITPCPDGKCFYDHFKVGQ